MRLRRPSRFTVVAALTLGIALTFPVYANLRGSTDSVDRRSSVARATRKTPKPRVRPLRAPRDYPIAAYGLTAAYYSVRGQFDARLILNNKGDQEMHPRVTLYAQDGRRYVFNDVPVGPHTFVDLDLRPLVTEAGSGFEEGSILVSYIGQQMEMGGQVRITDLARGIGFDEMLAYPSASRSNRLEGLWWLPNDTALARLVVTNTSSRDVKVTVRFQQVGAPRTESLQLGPWQLQVLEFGRDHGREWTPETAVGGISIEHDGAPGAIVARGMVADRLSKYSANVVFFDLSAAQTSTLHGAGVRLVLNGRDILLPVIVARNLSAAPTRLTGRLQVRGSNGQVTAIELPNSTLAPRQVRIINAREAWRRAAELDNDAVGLEFEYSSAPGSVLVSAASVSADLDDVLRIPLTDPLAEPSASGGYYWQVDGAQVAVAFIKNVTDEPRRFNLVIRFEGGLWAPGLSVVQPHETTVIDISAIRAERRPDAKGRTMPLGASFGQLHWSLVGGKDRRGLIGRVEQVDSAHGVNLSYTSACPLATEDNYYDSWIDPESDQTTTGAYVGFGVWEQDEGAYDHEPGEPYDISDTLTWQSSNSAVASSAGSGSFYGESEGTTSAHAYGDSNGWEDYQGEGQPGDHVWISLYADVSIVQIYPDQITRDTNFGGGTTSNNPPRLQFHYTWTWSSGGANELQLAPCWVWEDISYDPATWPNPPYTGNPNVAFPNKLWDAVNLGGIDTHQSGMPFTSLPASPPNPSSYPVTGTQHYKYSCDNGATMPEMTGSDHGPLTISRNVFLKLPFLADWRHEISKHGVTRGCDLNPTTKNCQ